MTNNNIMIVVIHENGDRFSYYGDRIPAVGESIASGPTSDEPAARISGVIHAIHREVSYIEGQAKLAEFVFVYIRGRVEYDVHGEPVYITPYYLYPAREMR